MNSKKILATLMISSVLFTGCGLKNSQAIIKVNNAVITQKQYDDLMDKQIAQSPFAKLGLADFKKDKDGMLYLMLKQRVVSQLIVTELLDQEAKARGVKVTNKDVDKEISQIIDNMGGKDKLMEVLKQNNVTVSEFKKDIKTQVKMQKLAHASENINITDKDCKDYYTKNINKFKQPEQVRASHILLSANPFQIQQEIKSKSKNKTISENELKKQVQAKIDEQKALADKLSKELKADSKQFAAYAKKYSQDPGSAKQGGDLGFFAKDRMVPEFAKAAFSAKPNTVLSPVKTDYGYHIIFVTDRKAATTLPFEKVKSDIKQYLTSEAEIKALDDLSIASKKKSNIEIIDKDYDPEEISKKLEKQVGSLKNQVQGKPAKSAAPVKSKK